VLAVEVEEEIVVVDMEDDVDERIGLEEDKAAGEVRVTKKATSVPPPRNTTTTSTVTTRPIP
jgi:hypothetical protein